MDAELFCRFLPATSTHRYALTSNPFPVLAHEANEARDTLWLLRDDGAAWAEAAAACSDIIRNTTARVGDSPEWRLEVVDKAGAARHLSRITAKTFDP
jgi:hypothetical protein